MDQWNDNGGGGYFGGNDVSTPTQAGTKAAPRQQFLCPVTVRQVLEASEEGLKVGPLTATMVRNFWEMEYEGEETFVKVSLTGIVTGIEVTSTKIKFCLYDDTGIIECLEWIESEDDGKPKNGSSLEENAYYHVYGCIKSPQGHQKIMVFKTVKIKDFSEITTFMLEVLNVNEYAEKVSKMVIQTKTPTTDFNSYNSYSYTTYDDNRTAFTPVQKAVLDAIKAVGTQVGWSKYDPEFRKLYSAKQIQDALDFLVGEGHIYTTVDDDHFCST